ncbi:MAG: L,D-transpeptidase family protein [Alphaproteobacteria bacterium]|nr:L,D-transpeptidase family protein [Alphaproteobacteria bacterium]MBV9693281.1 L,D-transpeptidase family protein [Alphaproteobacteria bacterium]
MRTLTALSAIYLASAAAFGTVIAFQQNPELQRAAQQAGERIWPGIQRGAAIANERAVKPAAAQLVVWDKAFFDYIDPPKQFARAQPAPRLAAARPAPKAEPVVHFAPVTVSPPVAVAKLAPPEDQPASPALRPSVPDDQVASAQKPAPLELAPQAEAAARPELASPGASEVRRVVQRLKDNLTSELLANFELFLYVSKAEDGPWAQRMYVFRKQAKGDLDLLYNWPVSTGRELVEYAPNGQRAPSFTPQGYYELDPDRMYRHHVSGQWNQSMPYAMFFNWERDGLQTGLAIHGATSEDVAMLGKRASAGCVRIAPQNAALLFNLIKTQYRGLAPRFAYDRRTATMSNDGLLMHDAEGHVKLADGYKVLVFIENYGGDNVVAAVF